MKHRYSILVSEHGREYELCQVETNPQAVAKPAVDQQKLVLVNPNNPTGRKHYVPKYAGVRIVDNVTGQPYQRPA